MARKSKRTARAVLPTNAPMRPDTGRVFAQPKASQRPLDEALNIKPQGFVGVYSEASYGRTRRIVDLGKSSRRYDPRLNAVCATRTLAVGSRAYAIKPPPGAENDNDARRIADFVTRQFNETRNLPTLKQHLAHGVLEPHAVLEHIWSKNARGEVRTQPVWRHPNRFAWPDGEIAKLDPGIDIWPGTALSQYPNKFIVHSAVGGQSDYPWMRGALRPLLMLSLAGRFGMKWWSAAIERFGQPQIYATIKEGDSADPVITALRLLGSDWRAVVPEGAEFKALPVQVQEQLHQLFLDYCNTEKAIGILGQNLSTEVKGGSYAAAKSQERVRADILAADLAEIDETITDQWIRPLVIFNFGEGAPVPYIEHTLDSRVAFTLADYQAGICTADEYRASNGQDPEADSKGKRYSPAASTPATATLLPSTPSAPQSIDGAANAPDVASTGLNGAQIKELKQLILDIAGGQFPRESAGAFIAASFPGLTPEQISSMLPPVGFMPAPPVDASPGGAAAAPPLAQTSPTSTSSASPTSSTHKSTTHPLRRALSQS